MRTFVNENRPRCPITAHGPARLALLQVHKDHVGAVMDIAYSPTGKEFVSVPQRAPVATPTYLSGGSTALSRQRPGSV
jgi:hypothetical protein